MKDRDANGAVSKKHGLLTAVIIIAAAVLLQKLFILGMSRDCFRNAAEEVNALNAEETLIKYFEYWDAGDLYGQALIRDEEPPREYKSFDFWQFCDDIRLTDIRYIGTPTSFVKNNDYYDGKVYMVHYSKTIEEGRTGMSKGENCMEFVMCRKDEDSPWRLCAVGGLYVD